MCWNWGLEEGGKGRGRGGRTEKKKKEEREKKKRMGRKKEKGEEKEKKKTWLSVLDALLKSHLSVLWWVQAATSSGILRWAKLPWELISFAYWSKKQAFPSSLAACISSVFFISCPLEYFCKWTAAAYNCLSIKRREVIQYKWNEPAFFLIKAKLFWSLAIW